MDGFFCFTTRQDEGAVAMSLCSVNERRIPSNVHSTVCLAMISYSTQKNHICLAKYRFYSLLPDSKLDAMQFLTCSFYKISLNAHCQPCPLHLPVLQWFWVVTPTVHKGFPASLKGMYLYCSSAYMCALSTIK